MGDVQGIGEVCGFYPDWVIVTALVLELYQPAAKGQPHTEIKRGKVRTTINFGLINHMKLVGINTGDEKGQTE